MEQVNFKKLKAEDGREYIFNYLLFKKELKRTALAAKKNGDVSSIEEYKEGLADAIAVSTAAIKQWESGRNGVSDIERVQEIASYLGLEDYKVLLIEENVEKGKDDKNMTNCIMEEERKTAREVFNGMVEIIKMYKDTDAYADTEGLYGNPTMLEVMEKENEVELIIQRARFDIPEDIYSELSFLFFEIVGTLPEEISGEGNVTRWLQVERNADEYFERLCKIMRAYIK